MTCEAWYWDGSPTADRVYDAAPLPHGSKADNFPDQILFRREGQDIHPSVVEGRAQFRFAATGCFYEAFPESPIVGIQVYLFTGLGIFYKNGSYIRQLYLPRVEQMDRDYSVTLAEHAQRPVPTRLADEI